MMEHMNKRTKMILAIAGIYIAIFLILAPFDYPFSEFLTSHANSWFIAFGARLGPLPAALVCGYCILALGTIREKWYLYRVAAIAVIAVAAFNILKPDLSSLLEFLFMTVLWAIMFAAIRMIPTPENTNANEHILQFGILVTLISSGLVQLLKMLWGRPRFYALQLFGLDFVPWYRVAGFAMRSDAFRSFPSGHTAGAAAIFFLVFLTQLFPSRFVRRWKLWVFAGIYTLIIASTRIMAGMHFLTDVMGGCGVYLLTMVILAALFQRNGIDIWAELEQEELNDEKSMENKTA